MFSKAEKICRAEKNKTFMQGHAAKRKKIVAEEEIILSKDDILSKEDILGKEEIIPPHAYT